MSPVAFERLVEARSEPPANRGKVLPYANGYFSDIWGPISVFCPVGSDVKTGPGYGDWGTDVIRGCHEPSSAVI